MKTGLTKLFKGIVVFVILLGVVAWSRWHGFEWGTLRISSPGTITVTGSADGSQINQEASFYATITAENKEKEAAVQELTTQSNDLAEQLKAFGIPASDITTQNLSVYEYDKPISPTQSAIYPIPPYSTEKVWMASSTFTIKVKDISRVNELSSLLFSSGATNVSGPNFTTGDTLETEKKLLEQAMKNAEEKAQSLLAGTNQRLRKVVQVQEGSSSFMPLYRSAMPMAGGGVAEDMALEPGSRDITKTITVTFEIGR